MGSRIGLTKVCVYFDGKADAKRDALLSACRAQANINATHLSKRVDQRLAIRVTEMPVLPHQRVMETSPKPFDMAYQLSSPDEAEQPAMENGIVAMALALSTQIDRSTAAVLIGKEIAITCGDGPIYNIMPLRRLLSLDHEAFMHHWFDRHAALGEGIEGVRYRQNHIDYASTDALAVKLGFAFAPMDGLTESYFDSVDAAVSILSRDEVAVGAIEDERRFIDHARSQFAIYETIWRNLSRIQPTGGKSADASINHE